MTRWASPRMVWVIGTLPFAPLSAVAYFFFEWLFFVTKPSVLAELPLGRQIAVLVESPAPLVLPLVALQAVASLASIAWYPRIRAVTLIPSTAIGGLLLFVLVDNFTYTVFGFGVLTVGLTLRGIYVALLLALMGLVGWKVGQWTEWLASRGVVLTAAAILAPVMVFSAAISRDARATPDVNAPPDGALSLGSSPQVPNILFLGIDGVDAPRLSAYGSARDTTPFLTSLRDESLFFENAFSNVGRTHGSLVTLLTGRLPFTTRVTFPPTILQGEDAHRHLPQMLKERGYFTLQLGMRHYADAEDANLLGFDAANYRWQRLEDVHAGSSRDEVDVFRGLVAERLDERLAQLMGSRHVIDGLAHVEGRKESPYWSDERRVATLVRSFPILRQPWFVHAHLLDTHCCSYRPRRVHFSGSRPDEDAFDSQLREADDHVRGLFDALESAGLLDRTVVVISSDHTREWTTKGRVPLIIRFPGGRPSGRIVENVQLADVAPTILDFLGVPIPSWMDGLSLLSAPKTGSDRKVFGLSEVSGRRGVTSYLTALNDAGPPNYGAASATMIDGNRWFELCLNDGSLTSGPVPGHTGRRLSPAVSGEHARTLLMLKLRSAGFEVAPARQRDNLRHQSSDINCHFGPSLND